MLPLLVACAPWPSQGDGTWAITHWTATLDGQTVEAADAGVVTFEGDGTWWESTFVWDGPRLFPFEDGFEVLPDQAVGYWTLDDGDLWLVWTQDYASPEVIVFDPASTGAVRIGASDPVPGHLDSAAHTYTWTRP